MADVYPPSNHTYYERKMRRTAPPTGSSRIPLSSDVAKMERFPSAPQPSRLEQMQANFQYKVMKEKEAKMIDMYQRQQHQALQTIAPKQQTQKGMVRDFFRERRMIEQQGTAQSDIPTRDKHFYKMKLEVQQQREANKRQELSKMYSREDLSRRLPPGLDRSKPLAPLKHRNTVHNMNVTPNFPEAQHKPAERSYTDEYIFNNNTHVPLAKKKLTKANSLCKLPRRYSQNMEQYSDEEPIIEKPKHINPPQSRQPQSKQPKTNPHQRWEQSQFEKQDIFVGNKKMIISEKKEDKSDFDSKISHKRNERKDVAQPRKKEEKMSDFQKWQMEQDLERQQRLNKLRKQKESDEDEQFEETNWRTRHIEQKHEVRKKNKQGVNKNSHDLFEDGEIKRKERELQEMIAREEAELKKIKESCMSDDDTSTRHNQLDDSMKQWLQTKKPKKPIEKPETLRHPTPPKTKKPAKGRRSSIQNNALTSHHKQPQKYEEEDTMGAETNNSYYGYDIIGALKEDNVAVVDLKACNLCGRKFAVDRLANHTAACRKASNKKRKTFDMTKQRTAGTELAQYVQNGRHLKSEPMPRNSNWKRKHQEFLRTVRDARVVQAHIAKGGKVSDLPPPPPSDNSDYKPCPYCKRRFNPATAERHIPKCKDIKSRPKPPSKRR